MEKVLTNLKELWSTSPAFQMCVIVAAIGLLILLAISPQ